LIIDITFENNVDYEYEVGENGLLTFAQTFNNENGKLIINVVMVLPFIYFIYLIIMQVDTNNY